MENIIKGRIWRLGDDIDTDVIMMTKYLGLPTLEEMIPHLFEPLRPELAAQLRPGDIIVGGKNFGCGSSREAAASVLKTVGISCIIAKSFAKIFFRNALNNGLLLIECKDLFENCEEGDTAEVHVNDCVICNGKKYSIPAIDSGIQEILEDGGLVEHMRRSDKAGIKDETKEKPWIGSYHPGRTMAQQLVINNVGFDCAPGDMVTVNVDKAILHDIYVPYIFNQFRDMGFDRVYNKKKCILMMDHMYPNCNYDDPRCYRYGNRFEDEYGIIVHRNDGICHQVVKDKKYAEPGSIVFGTDSHTTTYGAFGSFATGVGYTEMASIIGTGKLWIRVPSSIKVVVNGKLPKGVYAKDVILRVLGDIKADGAVYKALEFTGSTFDEMSISSRMSIANMSVECGAKVALFEPNDAIAEMFGIDRKELEWLRTGEDECYERVLEYRAEDLVPVMACPPKVDNVHPVSEVAGTPVNQVFIGSCTNGRIEDLEAAAEILKGKHVAPFVKFLVTPASREVYEEAEKKGLLKIFIRAGAMITHPYCSLCQGRNGGVVSAGEVVIGTHNRNFRGRMGSPEARTYLASPAVAAASALCGKITDPRTLES
ncbi:MAG: 3-isopropylmalate dehydratase large subunit [Oscillospiraceae bacterium]|nr:3-isopropylmalate dehydratase large subunit [Oscillospiraceae bacterium]